MLTCIYQILNYRYHKILYCRCHKMLNCKYQKMLNCRHQKMLTCRYHKMLTRNPDKTLTYSEGVPWVEILIRVLHEFDSIVKRHTECRKDQEPKGTDRQTQHHPLFGCIIFGVHQVGIIPVEQNKTIDGLKMIDFNL